VGLLLRAVWGHVYVQGDGVRCFVSTTASTFPERPCVDLQGFLGDGSNKLESADAVLAGHYNKGGGIECYVVLNGLFDVSVRLQVLVVDVPNAVLMCAAWCCMCRRGGDILRVSACWVTPYVAV
jgi:hypothetical protein